MSRDHDELQARIWNDDRMAPGTREVALAVAWVLHREPGHPPGNGFWKRVTVLAGHSGGPHPHWRVHDLIAGDAPRYDPGGWWEGAGECEGPRLRPYKSRREPYNARCLVPGHHPHVGDCRFTVIYDLGGHELEPVEPERDNTICGARGTSRVVERDMVTGWETTHWFCRRHLQRAAEVKAQLAARGEPPEPIPNRGGCLPRYFKGDWAAIYRKHTAKSLTAHSRGWTPSYYGVDADEWPIPGRTVIPKRPRLAVVAS